MSLRHSPGFASPAASADDGRTGVRRLLRDRGVEKLDMRWRFRIVVLAFGLPFLAYIVWSAAQQAMMEKEHVRERARSSASLVAARFEDHVQQIDRLLATLAQGVGAHFDDAPAVTALLQGVRVYVPQSVDNIGVWSLEGKSVNALDRRSSTRGVNIADRQYFRDAVERRDFVFEGPLRSRTTGTDIIQFARPVADAGGRLLSIITLSVRTDRLIDQLDPGNLIGSAALVAVVDERGMIVARSIDSAFWVGKPAADQASLAAAFASGSGTREVVGLDGRARLTGYAAVPGRPWLVTVGEPVEKVMGPAGVNLMRNLAIGLAIFGVALLIAGRVASWTTRPLMQLAVDADRLGGGDLSYRSSVVTGGEIATLAADFNRMAAALEQRETALAASRLQLRAIADNIPEQITYIDRDERYRFINAYPGPFLNSDRDAMIGRTVREVRGETVYETLAPAIRRAMEGETHGIEIARVVDGKTSHYSINYAPDFDEHGNVRGVYAFGSDITKRRMAECLRIESEKRLVTITDNLPALITYVDDARRFRFANRAFEKWLARPLADIVGQPFDRVMPPDLAVQFDVYFLRGMQGERLDYELRVPLPQGPPRWLKCAFIPDLDEVTGRSRGVYGMIHDVTKAKKAEQRLTRLARFDTLTGLANRHHFNETLARVLDATADREPLALMFLDIDHFKEVNDRYGHGGGDLLLKEFAQRLTDCVRPTDAVARLAGDEFVVLLEGMHSDDEPQFIARKIIAAVEKPFRLDAHSVAVTASIGIAMRAHAGESASTLMKRADEALYEAKRAGRNTFRLAS